MGDRTSVAITIGGALPRSAVAEFVAAAECDGMGLDWGQSDLTEAHVLICAEEGEAVYLTGNEINYANLDELEAFCAKHVLPCRKEWEAGGGYPMGGELSGEAYAIAELGGDVLLDATEIRKLGTFEAVLAELDRLAAPIPPITITEV